MKTNMWIFWNFCESFMKLSMRGRSFILLKVASRIQDATFEYINEPLPSRKFLQTIQKINENNHKIKNYWALVWWKFFQILGIFLESIMKLFGKGGSIFFLFKVTSEIQDATLKKKKPSTSQKCYKQSNKSPQKIQKDHKIQHY